MKTRLLIAFLSFIIVALIAVYILIPSPLIVSGSALFHSSLNGSYRTLIRQDAWNKLTPGDFNVTKRLANSVELSFGQSGKRYPISILILPKSADSTTVLWRSQFAPTYNPVKRISQYSQATRLHGAVDKALENFQSYVSNVENVYGAPIVETSTKDTFLIATRFKTSSFPSINTIYSNINRLKSYANTAGASIVSSPMLNISTTDSINYNSMVALPVNKIVDGNENISFVRMVPGRFLTTEVKGGPARITAAHKMMDQYFKDYNRVSMAIPFEYLVTDRLKESDTSKWVTKIYCPVY